MLQRYVPTGKPVSLSPTVLASSEQARTAQRLILPATVRLVVLPLYCPKLNPIERLWRDLKDARAWQQFPDLEAQQDYVGDLLRAYDGSTLHALTGYTYLVEAIHALST